MVGAPLCVEQHRLLTIAQSLHECDEGDLRCVAGVVEHRLPRNESPKVHHKESSHEQPALVAGLHAVRVAGPVQILVGGFQPGVDPSALPARIGALREHVGECLVEADGIARHALAQAAGDPQTVQRQNPAWVR